MLPLFSVIMPLEYHRGQWDRGWRAWEAQSFSKSAFELILVMPPSFDSDAELDALPNFIRTERSAHNHDIGLCADGAARARGKFLFFTESHCWPDPDVLTQCQKAFEDHPEWAGFSCRSVGVVHNRLSVIECAMYQADIDAQLQSSAPMILDQCFVTRREAYESSGGFRPELGHFAELALSKEYADRGHMLGYLPDARFSHYYIGKLDELRDFTTDFIRGEISYFSESTDLTPQLPSVAPEEWYQQGNHNVALARALFRTACRSDLDPGKRPLRTRVKGAVRWVAAAITGDRWARFKAVAAVVATELATRLTTAAGTAAMLERYFKAYMRALIRQERLANIAVVRRAQPAPLHHPEGGGVFDPHNTAGFYALERFEGKAFRWSETAAAIRMPSTARHFIRIECIPVRPFSADMALAVYLDGHRIDPNAISVCDSSVEILLRHEIEQATIISFVCRRYDVPGDLRDLGLPVADLVMA